eukprot:GFUD01043331.1.p1 GENE.GFUD01043331.1~~GFUD01043331.1.p1  ORF type:complete len:158 (-),score=26.49 GFUD01043331.1:116-589(-)
MANMMKTLSLIMIMVTISMAQPLPVSSTNPFLSRDCTMCLDQGTCRQPSSTSNSCICVAPYIDQQGEDSVIFENRIIIIACNYEAKRKLVTFLISFLLGGIGADWFYLSSGDAGYIVAGIFKLLTCGGFGIWYVVDWIRVLVGTFGDGNGMELFRDM